VLTKNEKTIFASVVAGLILLFVAILIGMPILIGYSRYQDRDRALIYRTFEGWTYRRIEGTRNIAVVSARNLAGDANGMLTIPHELNGRRVVQLGDLPAANARTERRAFVTASSTPGRFSRIVIPDGIHVDPIFWLGLERAVEYVEFLGLEPGGLEFGSGFENRIMTIIVPDGRGSVYREAFNNAYVIERSQFNPHPVWRYYRINQTEAVITRLHNLDAVRQLFAPNQTRLTIPTEINGLTVTRLGSTEELGGGQIFFTGSNWISRLVIPDGIYVERTFWRSFHLTDTVEMLSSDPTYLSRGSQVGLSGRTLIVPHGSGEAYLEWLGWSRWLNIEELK